MAGDGPRVGGGGEGRGGEGRGGRGGGIFWGVGGGGRGNPPLHRGRWENARATRRGVARFWRVRMRPHRRTAGRGVDAWCEPPQQQMCDAMMRIASTRTSKDRYLLGDVIESKRSLLVEPSLIAVPLVAHGKVLGAISLVSTSALRQYGTADLLFVEDIAQRAA